MKNDCRPVRLSLTPRILVLLRELVRYFKTDDLDQVFARAIVTMHDLVESWQCGPWWEVAYRWMNRVIATEVREQLPGEDTVITIAVSAADYRTMMSLQQYFEIAWPSFLIAFAYHRVNNLRKEHDDETPRPFP